MVDLDPRYWKPVGSLFRSVLCEVLFSELGNLAIKFCLTFWTSSTWTSYEFLSEFDNIYGNLIFHKKTYYHVKGTENRLG